MRKFVDFDTTIRNFFKEAIWWLEDRPMHLRDGVDHEKITYEYMKKVAADPRKYTKNNIIYANCDKLEGFLEYGIDRMGNMKVNNDLYFAVIRVLGAIGKYYEVNYPYAQMELMESMKAFKIALNRKNILKATFYMMQKPYYFVQKQK